MGEPRLARTMAQPVPKGPLAARIHDWTLDPVRAGAVGPGSAIVENAGSVPWLSNIFVSYHWLDDRGNAIEWDGIRNPLPHVMAPGDIARVELAVQGPMPPGRYRFQLDLIAERRAWFGELGGRPVESDVDVVPRIRRGLAVQGADAGALDAQEEAVVPLAEAEAIAYLGPGVAPAPDWSRRILDAHQEGYAVVGGSISVAGARLSGRRARAQLEPWQPGTGRVPRFPHPLVCPSLVVGVDADWVDPVAGLPALLPRQEEPWLEPAVYDGRITARLRFDRRRG
jgi:hypothetical protein